jgi:D-proline reductase (dithiol) PrdB
MARLADLKLKYRLFMRAYPYRRIDWRPGTQLFKPLAESRIALLTSAGFFLPGQPPFDESIRGGDWSFREIPSTARVQSLHIGHRSDAFDHTGVESDQNLALPLDRLRELVQAGEVGSASPRHFSIMGSIVAPGRLISESAPEIVRRLEEDKADAVFLTPV